MFKGRFLQCKMQNEFPHRRGEHCSSETKQRATTGRPYKDYCHIVGQGLAPAEKQAYCKIFFGQGSLLSYKK